MVKVKLIKKIFEDKESRREELDSKDLELSKDYKKFLKEIEKAFNIKKNAKFYLMAITEEDDENIIESQDDLDDNIDINKEFLIIFEGNDIINRASSSASTSSEKITSKKIDKPKEEEEEKEKENDEKEEDKGDEEDLENPIEIELGEEKINFSLDLNIKDSEIEKIIDSQIKNISKISDDINDDIQFNIDEFKKELNDKETKVINDFKSIFNTKIDSIISNKSQIMKNKINSSLLSFSKSNIQSLDEINKDTGAINEDLKDIVGKTEQMNDAMVELSEKISPNAGNKPNVDNQQNKEKGKKKDVLDEEDNDDEGNKICFKFKEEKEELEIPAKDAKFITIENIEIEKIINDNKEYNKVYFVIDKKQSDKDITFMINQKNIYAAQLTPREGFKYKKPEIQSMTLKIENINADKTYTAYIYIQDNIEEDSPKLSKPLIINIKIKKEEVIDQSKVIKDEAIKLYNELKESHKLSELCTQDEAIKKFTELNNSKSLIDEWINEKKEEQNKKKAEEIYNQLNSELQLENNNFNKNDILDKIKLLNYNKEKITEWANLEIQNKKRDKAEKMSGRFNTPDNVDREQLINQIISLNFNEEEINQWLDSQRKQNPNQADIGAEDPRMNELLNLFDEEYSILSILEEEEVKEKIKELEYQEDKIREWIEVKISQ